jgi:gliding motility-associated-like protein
MNWIQFFMKFQFNFLFYSNQSLKKLLLLFLFLTAVQTSRLFGCSSITSQPANTTACAGANATFAVSTIGTGTVFQWQLSIDGGSTFTNLSDIAPYSGTNTNQLVITPATTMMHGFTYRCVLDGGCNLTSNVTLGVYPAIQQVSSSNIVGYYPFNGNANDESGTINQGNLQNAPSLTTDRYGNANSAYQFNGVNQYISTSKSFSNPTNFTISIWFKTTTVSGGKLVGFGNNQTGTSTQADRHLYMDNLGKIYFGINNTSLGPVTISSALSYNDGNWHCATATLSSTNGMRLYIDGSMKTSIGSVTSAQNFTGYWKIGYDLIGSSWISYPSSDYFNGSLDDVFIYNRELNATEVASLSNNVLGAGSNSPVCPGGTLNLTAPSATSYTWTGPNSFLSSSQNPSVPNMSATTDGVYTVNISSNSCVATLNVLGKIDNTKGPSISQIQTAGLQYNYKLDGNPSDAQKLNNGSSIANPSYTTDRFGNTNSAILLDGSSQYITTDLQISNPQTFSVSAWFKTSTTQGGKIIGFSGSQTGISTNYDRHIYMSNTGQLYFGIFYTTFQTINSTASYNDNAWHLVTGTFSHTDGTKLFVDGNLVAYDPTIINPQNYNGYWRIGFDNCSPWPGSPTSNYFNGSIDDVLIYNTELTSSDVRTLFTAGNGAGSNSPVCTGTTLNLTCPSVAGATYSWSGPNGFTSTTQNPTVAGFAAANVGTYIVTVTSGSGCKNTASTIVTKNDISTQPTAKNICNSTSTSFSLATSNTNCGFQWQVSTDGGTTYTNLYNSTPYNGAFTNTLTISNSYPLMNGYYYRCAVGGSCGNTNAVSLTVNPAMVQISRTNIEGYFPFNSNSYDESGKANTGYVQGSPSLPTLATDRFGNANSALLFNETNNNAVTTFLPYTNPINFTISCWFKTSTTHGGKLIGFGDQQVGASAVDDRHIYMSNNGNLYFGVYPSAATTISSPLSYNDNKWHMVTASLSSTNGMKLYIDGNLVASNSSTTSAQNYTGYWKIGYDYIGGMWTSSPTSNAFSGYLDDVFIFSKELVASDVALLYNSALGAGNNGPVCTGGTLTLDATYIAGVNYSWTGPNSFTSATKTPSVSNMSTINEGTYAVNANDGTCSITLYTNGSINTALNPTISKYSLSGLQLNYPINAGSIVGNTIIDKQYFNHGTMQGSVTTGSDRFGNANEALVFNGSSNYISTTTSYGNPTDFTLVLWFKTSVGGGRLIGFGNSQTGVSTNYDRHIYMSNSGQLYFGINQGGLLKTVNTTTSYNDNTWHQVIATLSSTAGIKLYVDGTAIAMDPTATTPQNYVGYWRIGYDDLTSWLSKPSNNYFTGSIDEVYIYNRELAPSEVMDLYTFAMGAGSNSPVCQGASLNLLGGFTGAGPTFSWTGPNSFSSALNTPTISNYTTANAGLYTYKATMGSCYSTAYALVTTKTGPSAPTAADSSRCGTGTVTLAAYGSGLGYNWYSAATGGSPVNSTSSWTTGSLTATTTYYVSATSSGGCESYPRLAVKAIINALPVAPTVNPVAVCSGSSASITASGSPLGYKWYDASTAGNLLASTATYTSPNLSANTNYYVTSTNSFGCESSPRTSVTVTVNAIPSITSASTGTVCSGSSFSYTITSSVGGSTYSWDRGTVTGITNPAVSGQSANPIVETLSSTLTTATNVIYVITPTANGCTGSAFNYTVTVNPLPAVTSASTGSACSGVAQNYNITSNVSGTTYTWSRNSVSGVSNGTVAGQTSNPITEILNNTLPGVVSVTYQIIPTANGCSGTSFNYIVSVYPSPGISSSSSGTICSNVAQNYTITSGTGGTTYSWSRATVTGISNGSLSGQTSNPITESLINTTTSAVTVTYSITPTASGCSGSPFTYSVLVNPAPSITSSATGAICTNIAQNYSITSSLGGTTYNWSRATVAGISNGATASTSNPITETLVNTTTGSIIVAYNITPVSGGCTGSPFTYSVTVNPVPTISSSSSGTVCSNNSQNYTITSSITGTTYSWSRATVTGISNTSVSGQTANPITESLINTTSAPVNVSYSIIPSVSGCSGTVFNYSVSVNPSPTISSVSSGTICSGTNQSYTITSATSGASFSWSRAAVAGITEAAVSSQTSNPITESLTNSTTSTVHTIYQITATASGCSGPTFSYDLSVKPLPTITSSATGTICSNVSQSYSISASIAGSSYSWGRATVTGISNTSVSGQSLNTITESLVNTTINPIVVTYNIVPTANGCTGPSSNYAVTVNPAPTVNSGTTGTICSSNAQNYNITSTISGTTYNWSRATVTGISNGSVSGQTANPITESLINTTSSAVNVVYNITPSASGCSGTAFNYTVSVNPSPTISSVSSGTICSGVNQSYTITSATAGASFNWSRAIVTGITEAAVSGQTSNPIAESLTNTTTSTVHAIYQITATAAGCTGPTFSYDLSVKPLPSVTSSATGTICSNVSQSYSISASIAGSTYNWSRATVSGISNGSVSSQTSNPITESLINTTTNPVIVIYNITPTANGCTGSSLNYAVTVNPTPTINSVTTGAICSNTAQNYNITSTVSGTSYSWSRAVVTGISNTAVSGQTTNPITESLQNTGASSVNVTYIITPTANGCAGSNFNYIVSVNPTPSITSATTGTVCSNVAQNYLITSSTTGTTYTWDRAVVTGISNAGVTSQPSNPITEQLINTGSTSVNVTYIITPSANSCIGTSFNYTVTVNPKASITSSNSGIICSGIAQNYSITSNGTGTISYSWDRASVTGISNAAVSGQTSNPILETLQNTTGSAVNVTYTITPTVNGCLGNSMNYVITVNPTPSSPGVTTPVNYCINASSNPLTATGSNLLWYTTSTGGTGNSSAPTPSTTTAGSTPYYVSQTLIGCESARTVINVTVNALPPQPTVTTPIDYCQSAASTPLTATGNNLLWYASNSGGTGTSTAPTPSTSTAGIFSFFVSQTSTGGCEGNRAKIDVNINANPGAPNATTPVNYCQNQTASQLTATGNSLLWYQSPTGGTGTSTAPTPVTSSAGTFSFYVSQTSSVGCEGSRAKIDVVVINNPTAPAATSPIDYCQNDLANPLTAPGTNLLWYSSASGGTGNSTAPTPSTTSVTTLSFFVSQTSGTGCESNRTQIDVNINPIPSAPSVTTPVAYCQSSNATSLTATGTNILWYSTSSGGTGLATSPIPSTSVVGSTSYFATQTSNQGCESPRAQLDVIINGLPATPTVTTPVTYCQNSSASPLSATGTNLLWYTNSTGGTSSSSAPTPSTTNSGTFSYYVTQTDGNGCESTRNNINVVVDATTQPGTLYITDLDTHGGTISLVDCNGSVIQWEGSNDSTNFTVLTGQKDFTHAFANGEYEYYKVLVQSGSCPNKYTTVFKIEGFEIYTSVTPNDDGINDTWIIKGIERYLNNNVTIFNRYGDLVYEEEGYDNSNKVWNGKSNKGVFSGTSLPDGSYFYMVKVGKETKTGYVVIKR